MRLRLDVLISCKLNEGARQLPNPVVSSVPKTSNNVKIC